MIDLDMRLLRSFVSVATERSFSRSAVRLGCSQGTISLRVKTLEDILDRKLFKRSYHLVELTAAGAEILPHARDILDRHDALFDHLRNGKIAGSVSFGIAEDYGETFLSRLIRVINGSFPGIELSVTCAMSVKLQKGIERRDLDLAIVTLPNKKSHSTLLSSPNLLWVSAEDYVPDRDKPWPVAFYSEGCAFRAAAEEALRREGSPYREVVTTGSGEVIKSVVGSGTAITVMAEGTVPAGLRVLHKDVGLPPLPPSCIQLVEREDGLSKAAQQVKVSVMKLLGIDPARPLSTTPNGSDRNPPPGHEGSADVATGAAG